MNVTLKLAARTFPARIAELGFAAVLPEDWISHDLPQENAEFSNPTFFVPLAVVTAPHAAIVFAFAARPAYEDGTLHDWSWYLLNHNKMKPRAVGRSVIAGVPAIVGEAVQDSELGLMIVRFAFLEDGDRLINLTFTGPEILDQPVRASWFELLRTFALESPRGSRFKPEPGADDVPAAPIPEPWLERKDVVPAPEPESTELETPTDEFASAPVPEPEMITTAVTEQTTEAAPVSRTDPADYSNPAPVEPPSDGKPTWWREALALEAKGELRAAEKRIEDGCPHMSFAYCIADMYRMRMLRLMNAGDKSGAHEAFRKSSSFIFYYASMATSGGEGAALSVERDEFRARLVREYGSDPEAR